MAVIVAAALLALAVAAEVAARLAGLGDPPLLVADPQIEYLFKPSSRYSRFGNRIEYNAYSMRSREFPARKPPGEYRVMVLGDSVVNGEAHLDQDALATSILERELRAALRGEVVVGNISAGSWGPQNLLAYVRRFGLFDADVVVIVLSSHDYADAPTFEPLVGTDPRFPQARPLFALQEILARLRPAAREPARKDDASASSLAALRELLRLAKTRARVVVLQHPDAGELEGRKQAGFHAIQAICRDADVPVVDLAPALSGARAPYRDFIHLNAEGQRVLAAVLFEQVRSAWDKAHARH
jgi:hypothetical protein